MNVRLVIICVLAAIFGISCQEKIEGKIEIVTAEEIEQLSELDEVQFVDAQYDEDCVEGYLANSQNIDFNSPTFALEIEKLDKSKPVIVHCEPGAHSANCDKEMKNAGYVKIYDLDDRMAKWKFKGYDIQISP